MNTQEKSKVIAGKVGIGLHEPIHKSLTGQSIFRCNCGFNNPSLNKLYKHFKDINPDFFTPEGQAILEEKLWAVGSSDIGTKFTIWAEKTKQFDDDIDNEHIWTDIINSVELGELFYEFIEGEKDG